MLRGFTLSLSGSIINSLRITSALIVMLHAESLDYRSAAEADRFENTCMQPRLRINNLHGTIRLT